MPYCGTAGLRHDIRGQHVNKGLAIVFTAWLGFASALGAQPMYVIDQLFLGVHEIIAVHPTHRASGSFHLYELSVLL